MICPITLDAFRDPVVAADGHSYERVNIERWFRESSTSPATGAPVSVPRRPACLRSLAVSHARAPVVLLRWQLVTDVVVSNHALRKSIEEHAQHHALEAREGDEAFFVKNAGTGNPRVLNAV